MRNNLKGKSASAFMEYAIILGVVSVALMAMNIYMKRGIQGRLADLSDYFISREHLVELTPTNAETNTVDNTTANREGDLGGSTNLVFSGDRDINATSRMEDDDALYSSTFIPADRGYVIPPDYPDTNEELPPDYPPDDDSDVQAQIEILQAERNHLLSDAAELEAQADELQEAGEKLVKKAKHMDCEGSDSCHKARKQLKEEGYALIDEAEQKRKEADQLRKQAALIQLQINQLCQECGCCGPGE